MKPCQVRANLLVSCDFQDAVLDAGSLQSNHWRPQLTRMTNRCGRSAMRRTLPCNGKQINRLLPCNPHESATKAHLWHNQTFWQPVTEKEPNHERKNMPKQRNQQQSKIGDKNSPCQRWLNKTTDAICFAIVCTTYLESQYGSVRRYKSHPKGFIHCISLHAKIDLMSLEYAGHYYGEERVN